MKTRPIYAILGLIIGAIVDLLLNLLASAIQLRVFPKDFSNFSIGWLIALSILGLLIGYWLGSNINIQIKTDPQRNSKKTEYVTMTRLKAFYSYITLRGKGIHLSDIFIVGSHISINSKGK
jgi:hypothetical protein